MHNDSMVGGHTGTMGGHQESSSGHHGYSGGGSQSYGYSTQTHHSSSGGYQGGMNQGSHNMGTLPHDQALHVNTGENRYATVGGQHSSGSHG